MKVSYLIFILFSFPAFSQLVGIGTDSPQKNLSVFGGLNIDQANMHGASLGANALTFGSNSNTGIASNRSNNNLLFFTNNLERMRILDNGRITIGRPAGFKFYSETQPLTINHTGTYNAYSYEANKHGFMIADNQDVVGEDYDGSYLYMGTNRAANLSYIQAERNGFGQNTGSTLLLQYLGNATIGFKASPTEKLEVIGNTRLHSNNHPNLSILEKGDLWVRGDLGIIRNNTTNQLLKQTKTVNVNNSFDPGQTQFYDFNWDEPYTTTPEAYVGNITSGTGGWAEVVMSLAVISPTGGRLYVYNPAGTRTPNFTVNILAFGVKD